MLGILMNSTEAFSQSTRVIVGDLVVAIVSLCILAIIYMIFKFTYDHLHTSKFNREKALPTHVSPEDLSRPSFSKNSLPTIV